VIPRVCGRAQAELEEARTALGISGKAGKAGAPTSNGAPAPAPADAAGAAGAAAGQE